MQVIRTTVTENTILSILTAAIRSDQPRERERADSLESRDDSIDGTLAYPLRVLSAVTLTAF